MSPVPAERGLVWDGGQKRLGSWGCVLGPNVEGELCPRPPCLLYGTTSPAHLHFVAIWYFEQRGSGCVCTCVACEALAEGRFAKCTFILTLRPGFCFPVVGQRHALMNIFLPGCPQPFLRDTPCLLLRVLRETGLLPSYFRGSQRSHRAPYEPGFLKPHGRLFQAWPVPWRGGRCSLHCLLVAEVQLWGRGGKFPEGWA